MAKSKKTNEERLAILREKESRLTEELLRAARKLEDVRRDRQRIQRRIDRARDEADLPTEVGESVPCTQCNVERGPCLRGTGFRGRFHAPREREARAKWDRTKLAQDSAEIARSNSETQEERDARHKANRETVPLTLCKVCNESFRPATRELAASAGPCPGCRSLTGCGHAHGPGDLCGYRRDRDDEACGCRSRVGCAGPL